MNQLLYSVICPPGTKYSSAPHCKQVAANQTGLVLLSTHFLLYGSFMIFIRFNLTLILFLIFWFFDFLQTEWKHPAQGYDSIFLHQYPWNRNLFVLVNSIQSSMRFPLKCYLELNTHSLKVSFPQIKPSISVLNSTFWNLNLINFSVQLFPFTLDSILFN